MNYGQYGRDLLFELKRAQDSGGNGGTLVPPYNDQTVRDALSDLTLHVRNLNEIIDAIQQQQQQKQQKPSSSSALNTSTAPAPPIMEVRPSMLLQQAAIERNKRCLLAYHWIRLQRIQQQYYWNTTTTAGNTTSGSSTVQGDNHQDTTTIAATKTTPTTSTSTGTSTTNLNLSPREQIFLQDYIRLQQQHYHKKMNWDLRAHAYYPPLNTDQVQVRVVDDTIFGGGGGNDHHDNHHDHDPNNNSGGPIVLESGQIVHFIRGSIHYLPFQDVEEYIRMGALQLLESS